MWVLKVYVTQNGKKPFDDWLIELYDLKGRAKITVQLDRLELGNFGKTKSIGKGIFETKIDFGPGYRIYFAHSGEKELLLLCGGDKGSQNKDILKAHEYWEQYRKQIK